jgi:hypothetical protein
VLYVWQYTSDICQSHKNVYHNQVAHREEVFGSGDIWPTAGVQEMLAASFQRLGAIMLSLLCRAWRKCTCNSRKRWYLISLQEVSVRIGPLEPATLRTRPDREWSVCCHMEHVICHCIFLDVAPCGSCKNPHLQGRRIIHERGKVLGIC